MVAIRAVLLLPILLSLFIIVQTEDSNNVRDYCNDPDWRGFNCTKCKESWKSTTHEIKDGNYEEFRDAIQPYMFGSSLLYSYRYEPPKVGLRGWKLLKSHYPHLNDGGYGMHAMAWRNIAEPWRVMVAIRGTWDVLPWGMDAKCDICAGWYLMKYMDKPKMCEQFTDEDMNYYDQLEKFIKELREDVEGDICLSFTGHSLGSLLASAMSVAWSGAMPAYSFSGPGIKWMAQNTITIPLSNDRCENVLNIYNQYDPMVEVGHFYGNQTGWLLKFDNKDVSDRCEKCIASESLNYIQLRGRCHMCLLEVHHLYIMVRDVFRDNRRPEHVTKYLLEQEQMAVVGK